MCSLRGTSEVEGFGSHTDYAFINLSFLELAKTPVSPHIASSKLAITNISITLDVLSYSPTLLPADISTDSYQLETISSSRLFQSVMPAGTLESFATSLTTTISPTVASQDMCEQCKTSCSSNTSSILGAQQEQLSGNKNSNSSGKKRFKFTFASWEWGQSFNFFHKFLASEMNLKLYADRAS